MSLTHSKISHVNANNTLDLVPPPRRKNAAAEVLTNAVVLSIERLMV